MASVSFLLKPQKRRLRRDLIYFFNALSLSVQAGYELTYSWQETLKLLSDSVSSSLKTLLAPSERSDEGMGSVLEGLEQTFPLEKERVWFGVLKELYASGASLSAIVAKMALTMQSEHQREFEQHCRVLPTKINLILLVFYLPPTMLLLFTPLILELLKPFS